MTEYDYSPEAYERYLATQTRIANWVDTTEAHRAEFQHALNAVPPTAPTVKVPSPPAGARPSRPPHAHRPPPLPLPPYAAQYYPHGTQPRSASSDAALSHGMTYDPVSGPGPMPLPASLPRRSPAYAPPPAYAPLLPHGAHQAVLYRPGQPGHRPSQSHRSPHSHSRRHHSSGSYYTVASPPVSPPYAQPPYAYPQAQRGYFVVQPQQSVPHMYMS